MALLSCGGTCSGDGGLQQHAAIGIKVVHGVIAGQRLGMGQQLLPGLHPGLERGLHGVVVLACVS
jgi:hypothetical protein